jgi:multicomponent K+:H+ antiporter subunit C
MELLLATATGLLAGAGVWLLLRPRTFDVILGLTLLSYAVNFFIFCMSRPAAGRPPILTPERLPTLSAYADPLPQALVLTAIVIGFGMTALLLAIAIRSHDAGRSDHVDGGEGTP